MAEPRNPSDPWGFSQALSLGRIIYNARYLERIYPGMPRRRAIILAIAETQDILRMAAKMEIRHDWSY